LFRRPHGSGHLPRRRAGRQARHIGEHGQDAARMAVTGVKISLLSPEAGARGDREIRGCQALIRGVLMLAALCDIWQSSILTRAALSITRTRSSYSLQPSSPPNVPTCASTW